MDQAVSSDVLPLDLFMQKMKKIIYILLAAMLSASCGHTRYLTETVTKIDSVYVDRVRVDSLYVRDSVFVREKGDTMYIYKEKLRDRFIYLHDTIARIQHDTVHLETTKQVYLDKKLNFCQRIRLKGFWILLALAAFAYRKQIVSIIKLIPRI